jgi:hypothetical protein
MITFRKYNLINGESPCLRTWLSSLISVTKVPLPFKSQPASQSVSTSITQTHVFNLGLVSQLHFFPEVSYLGSSSQYYPQRYAHPITYSTITSHFPFSPM